VQPTVKHGEGHMMVWGCMTAQGVGKLFHIEGTLTAEGYCQILEGNLAPSVEGVGV
jgi:hypothetical protein